MKFLVDAQLPKRLSDFLVSKGFDSIHTLQLDNSNATQDSEIITIADTENRILISKDSDFEDSFLIQNKPKYLILLSTGNISNDKLLALFEAHISKIEGLLKEFYFIEINQHNIIARR